MMYATPTFDEPLSQGDVLDSCPIFGLEMPAGVVDLDASPTRWRERIIILTQACDLTQTKTTKILVAVLHTAQLLIDRGILKAPTIRDQVRRGLVYGWYFLPTAPDPITMPESIIDLHDLHTVPRNLLERLVGDGKRVCRFLSPYREHLAQHFAVTYMRIGLPEPFETQ
jgi:hypothetical protein